jgi:hypothetical protein
MTDVILICCNQSAKYLYTFDIVMIPGKTLNSSKSVQKKQYCITQDIQFYEHLYMYSLGKIIGNIMVIQILFLHLNALPRFGKGKTTLTIFSTLLQVSMTGLRHPRCMSLSHNTTNFLL